MCAEKLCAFLRTFYVVNPAHLWICNGAVLTKMRAFLADFYAQAFRSRTDWRYLAHSGNSKRQLSHAASAELTQLRGNLLSASKAI